ncbi:methyltransferase domain-containing protein [Magnetococcales bacterium HHB-1]
MSQNVSEITKDYYDSHDADRFYQALWGGEDIHIGLYEQPDESVAQASLRTVKTMADRLTSIGPQHQILDLGSGYGGPARYLAKRFNCFVGCLNISLVQNRMARERNEKAGLTEQIEVIEGNFEQIPFEDNRFDVIWSQDAILHSGHREQVVSEVARVLKPGGSFLFTDILMSEEASLVELEPVLQRIHLASMATWSFYLEQGEKVGLKRIFYQDLTSHLVQHYQRILHALQTSESQLLKQGISPQYIERAAFGLQHWIQAGEKARLAWGIQHFQKSSRE